MFAPILGPGRKLEHALDHIGDKNRILALPNQGFARHKTAPTPKPVERGDFILIQGRTNRPVADNTLIA
jgi:hypothetical protein